MRTGLRYFATALVLIVLLGAGLGGKILDALNDHIDRCADETSGRYIWDKKDREIACKQ
ncbi:hypothetical protein [Rhizobium sp. SL86]|uniref:hypothetical protein n=1 Tax=Rhizobium sp. SL86 TaxID=2995148 RepID=UPI0022742AFB|nr:hypothetical protein [Rhizobium sp. SL86]MCY1668038.1 hypothetical protein [Rhizobium sp. SL86]